MHSFLELVTLAFFVLTVLHALRYRGTDGAWLMGSLFVLGALRETYVVLRDMLYGFAPLTVMLGRTPLLAAVIWGFSIYAAVLWAEEMRGERLGHRRPSTAWLLFVALFMISLAGFYEPLLSRVGLARWEEGTRTTFGVPWIALVGYPTLAVTFLLLWSAVLGRWQRAGHRVLALALTLTPLALAHAEGLHRLKHLLGW